MPAAVPRTAEAPLTIIEPLCAVFRRRLRDEGLKYTAERARILDAVLQFNAPFTVEKLLENLKGGTPRVSKATAYRTVKLLAEAGIVSPVPLSAEHAHYQLAYGQPGTVTIVNTQTGHVRTAPAPGLAELCQQICAAAGLASSGHALTIYASSPAGTQDPSARL